MKVRYFKKRAQTKVAVAVISKAVLAAESYWFAVPDLHIAGPNWFVDFINETANAQAAWCKMFNVYRKKDKVFVGAFETEAEAVAAIEKAKAQKKAALYIA
jgi:hypothetical protein